MKITIKGNGMMRSQTRQFFDAILVSCWTRHADPNLGDEHIRRQRQRLTHTAFNTLVVGSLTLVAGPSSLLVTPVLDTQLCTFSFHNLREMKKVSRRREELKMRIVLFCFFFYQNEICVVLLFYIFGPHFCAYCHQLA